MRVVVVAMALLGSLLVATRRAPRRRASSIRRLLDEAGHTAVSRTSLVAALVGSGLASGVTGLLVTGMPMIGLLASAMGAAAPLLVVRRRRAARLRANRAAWPDVVDDLASAVRAGLSLPEAVVEAGTRAPEGLRAPFSRFADDLRVDGRFAIALDTLKAALADPVADRVVEALRVAREVGGADLGRLLRDLSDSLRAQARLRDEVAARQSWTVTSARLAIAAPWITVGVLATRQEAVAAFDTVAGSVVLVGAAVVSVLAYRLMLVIGRVPEERRVMA